jgi:hypothetical protein
VVRGSVAARGCGRRGSDGSDHRGVLCRAVRLLSVFAAEPTAAQRALPGNDYDVPGPRVDPYREVAVSAEARRFAHETLHGSPNHAIRTLPVITIVDELRTILVRQSQPQAAHIAIRRAVRLLSVYVSDHEYERDENPR